MKKSLFVAALFVTLFAFGSTANAQSAIYFCTETGAIGYAYGYDYDTAINMAWDKCVEYGGTNPILVVSTYYTGYGAIYYAENSDGGRVIGAAVAYDTKSQAENEAYRQCKSSGGKYNFTLLDSWYDDGY